MKRFTPKFRNILLVLLILVVPLLVAAAPLQTGGEPAIPEAALTFATMLLLPALAQLYKVYQEKGGKPLSSEVITWVLFGLGVVASFIWGGSVDLLRSLVLPALSLDDPLLLIGNLLTFASDAVQAGGQVVGVSTFYYLMLKKLVFNHIPQLQTKQMAKELKAAK